MNGLEAYAKEQLSPILPTLDGLELRGKVGDSSYWLECFVQVEGKRMQCYDLVDEGRVDQDTLDQALARIAQYIRDHADYKKGELNEVEF